MFLILIAFFNIAFHKITFELEMKVAFQIFISKFFFNLLALPPPFPLPAYSAPAPTSAFPAHSAPTAKALQNALAPCDEVQPRWS